MDVGREYRTGLWCSGNVEFLLAAVPRALIESLRLVTGGIASDLWLRALWEALGADGQPRLAAELQAVGFCDVDPRDALFAYARQVLDHHSES